MTTTMMMTMMMMMMMMMSVELASLLQDEAEDPRVYIKAVLKVLIQCSCEGCLILPF